MGPARKRWNGPKVEPTSLTEITRRYVATAVALAKAMGLPLTEDFMRQHRESISCCFIEAGRAGVRLPPLTAPGQDLTEGDHVAAAPVATFNGQPEAGEIMCSGMPPAPEREPSTNGHTPPVAIPKDAGLPCAGVLIADLRPAQLALLLGKVARLVHDQGKAWVPLLGALQVERARRLERGRQQFPEADTSQSPRQPSHWRFVHMHATRRLSWQRLGAWMTSGWGWRGRRWRQQDANIAVPSRSSAGFMSPSPPSRMMAWPRERCPWTMR
jgi:hypothetical protein